MKKNDHTAPLQNMKRFRLVSIYVGNFGCFQNQTFNFCSDYTMVREPDRDGKLCLKVTYKKVLPDNFFSLPGMGKSCVDSVSAIIGANGAGKSTLARLLCNLSVSDDRKQSWEVALVYETRGQIYVYSTFKDVEICDESNIKIEIREPLWRLFYYSPYFTTEQFDKDTNGYHADLQIHDEGERVSDISTTWLMLHPEGNSELLLRDKILQSSIFDTDEKISLFEFVATCHANASQSNNRESCSEDSADILINNFDIPEPHAISIGIHTEGLQAAIRDISEKVESCRREESGAQKKVYPSTKASPDELRDPVGEYLRTLIKPFQSFMQKRRTYGLIVNVFMAYAARYIQECGMFNPSFPVRLLQEGYLPALREFIVRDYWREDKKIREFFETTRQNRIYHESNDSSLENPEFELITLLQKFCRYSKEQENLSRPVVRLDNQQMVLFCRLDDVKVLNEICQLVRLHGRTRKISSFMKFDVFPHMSSGEMSFLTLFSRLYHFIGKNTNDKKVVIFLDEAETTLHPEWQRRLVSYLIRFLNVFMPGRRYQLIFASHSPTLLSDIPKGNCVFLDTEKDEGGKPVKDKDGRSWNKCVPFGGKEGVGGKDGECDNTFGANIYDLYHNAFFLEHGAIGEFAETKIQDALKAVKESATAEAVDGKKPLLDENIDKLMNLVGDRIVHRYFQRLKEFGLITGAGLK